MITKMSGDNVEIEKQDGQMVSTHLPTCLSLLLERKSGQHQCTSPLLSPLPTLLPLHLLAVFFSIYQYQCLWPAVRSWLYSFISCICFILSSFIFLQTIIFFSCIFQQSSRLRVDFFFRPLQIHLILLFIWETFIFGLDLDSKQTFYSFPKQF